MTDVSRRELFVLAGSAAAPLVLRSLPARAAAALTAQAVVDRIKGRVGVEWKAETVDGFKAGDPAAVVTGIVTTAMATMSVLREAVKAKANLIITLEPTFYGRADRPTPPAGRGARPDVPAKDPVFAAKQEFIDSNRLVVWRFSDHWRARKPDPLVEGLLEIMGWSLPQDGAASHISVRATTLESLASGLKQKLQARGGMRVIGDPALKVQRVAVLPGATPIQASLQALPGVDVVVAGEVREWESVEYARDMLAAGEKKGMVLLGRVVSEEPGMRVCAQWLKTVVPELTTTAVRAGDPYWRPL